MTITKGNAMHHRDRNIHAQGFRCDGTRRAREPRTFNALPWIGWSVAIIVIVAFCKGFGLI